MASDAHIQALMADLIRAIEVSLGATEAARAAVAEILKRGAETEVSLEGSEPGSPLTLTLQDREFLSALSIRLEDR